MGGRSIGIGLTREAGSVSRPILLVGSLAVLVGAAVIAAALLLAPWPTSAESSGTPESGHETSTSGEFRDLTGVTGGASDGASGSPPHLEGEPFLTCEVCHEDFLEKPVQDADHDLIFSHQVHLDQDYECVTCHEPPLGHFDSPAPMMVACLSCHEGETAPHECKNCHRKIEEIAPGVDEPVVHLGPDVFTRKSCSKCHDVDTWCEECHGVVMPHPFGWRQAHTASASTRADTCVKCHQSRDVTFCVSCHGVEMPHPAFWYSSHGDVTRANPDVCEKCHRDAPQFCNECHHAGFAPTPAWAGAEHGRAVGSGGTGTCFVCHDQPFCERCHEPGEHVKR